MGSQSSKRISKSLSQNIVSNVKSSAIETHSAKKSSNGLQEAGDKGMNNNSVKLVTFL